jgi:two-component system, sensor histidine kinase LadS
MKKLLFLLLMTWALIASAGETRYRVETAYLQDTTEKFSVKDLAESEFLPFTDQLRLGFAEGNTWMRIRLVSDPDGPLQVDLGSGNPLMLVVGPYFLDRLNVFSWVNGHWLEQLGGAQHPKLVKICPVDLNCFELGALNDASHDFFLKINTHGARVVRAEVMPVDKVGQLSIERMIRIVVSLTLSITLLVLALVFLVLERTRLLLVYTGFQASVVLTTCAATGVLAYVFVGVPMEVIHHIGNLTQVFRIAMTVLLGLAFAANYKPSAIYVKATFALVFGCCVSLVLMEVGQVWLFYWLNLAVMVLCPLLHIWGSQQVQSPIPGKKFIQIGWCIYFAVVCIGALYSFGWLNWRDQIGIIQYNRDMRLNGIIFGLAVLLIVTHEKSKRKLLGLQALQQLELNAEKSRLQQMQLKERMALIDMLTHELKTPLSTIKFAISNLQKSALTWGEPVARIQNIDASVQRMDALIEHVAMSNKIERHDAFLEAEKIFAAELINEILQEHSGLKKLYLEIEEGAYFNAAPQFLTLIVDNLVGNAFKYASDGHVSIKVVRFDPSTTSFQISNFVSDENQPDEARLFERYYRHPNFQNLPGMGIGLSLVHSAAEKIGATVHYQRQGPVVTFEVRFPS